MYYGVRDFCVKFIEEVVNDVRVLTCVEYYSDAHKGTWAKIIADIIVWLIRGGWLLTAIIIAIIAFGWYKLKTL